MSERRADTYYVSDVATLKAVAHPLRVRLLGALRLTGPATASELARQFGESSGSTSYHLRQLARFGYVEEDADQPNARDKRWRAKHRYTSWSEPDFESQPEGAEASRWMRERQRAFTARIAETFDEQRATYGPDWGAVAGQSDTVLRLTAASLAELNERIGELVEEYATRDADEADAEQVAIFISTHPFRGYFA